MKNNIETSYNALRESEQYNRMLFEQSPIGLALCKPDGTVTDINPAFASIIGLSSVDTQGLSLWQLIPGEDHDLERERFQELRLHSPSLHVERSVLDSNGNLVPVEISYHLLDRAGDSYIGLSMQDISKRKASEMALAKSEEQLRQSEKLRAVGELTGGVAHDFNNLLAVVLGNAELINESLPEDSPQRHRMNNLIAACMRGADLTQQLLAYSRKQILKPEVTDMGKLVGKIVSMLDRVMGEEIEFETSAQPDIWDCHVDQGLLENALLNLMINARDAIQISDNRPGKVQLALSNATVDRTMTEVHDDVSEGEYVVVSVEDNGIGMPKEIQEKIFEPFFTTKPVGEGTGLGLSMIYGFVKQSVRICGSIQ